MLPVLEQFVPSARELVGQPGGGGNVDTDDVTQERRTIARGLGLQSLFCPVLPGDDQSSQHLTERYLMGCIPVFVGPPYHAMPLEQEVDYPRSAVFINVTNSRSWLGDMVMETSFPTIPRVWLHSFKTFHARLLYSGPPAHAVQMPLEHVSNS